MDKSLNSKTMPESLVASVTSRLFYYDQNRRVYEMNGVKKSSPYEEGYYIPIEIVSETNKEYICKFGTINKRSMMFSWGSRKHKTYTEKEKNDNVYVQENRHLLAEKVRISSADVLRKIEAVLNGL